MEPSTERSVQDNNLLFNLFKNHSQRYIRSDVEGWAGGKKKNFGRTETGNHWSVRNEFLYTILVSTESTVGFTIVYGGTSGAEAGRLNVKKRRLLNHAARLLRRNSFRPVENLRHVSGV